MADGVNDGVNGGEADGVNDGEADGVNDGEADGVNGGEADGVNDGEIENFSHQPNHHSTSPKIDKSNHRQAHKMLINVNLYKT